MTHYFLALMAASVIVPAIVLALAAWQNWHQLEAVAEDRARRIVGLVAEHALKVFENDEQALNRLDERLGAVAPEEIAASPEISAYLARLDRELDPIEGAGVAGPEGRLIAVNGRSAVEPLDLSRRDYIENAPPPGGPMSRLPPWGRSAARSCSASRASAALRQAALAA